MKVLIAGATGVVGRRLVKLFVSDGHEVAGLARSDQDQVAATVSVVSRRPARGRGTLA